jgi:hypothetical protein
VVAGGGARGVCYAPLSPSMSGSHAVCVALDVRSVTEPL